MTELLQQKYSGILSSGAYAVYSPEKLDQLHTEVSRFLRSAQEKLPASELFDLYELNFHAALLTNRDVEAKSMLDRLNDEFGGKKSQRLMVLKSMYLEGTGDEKGAISVLGSNPDELRASRRLATFSRVNSDGSENIAEYIKALNYYLNLQPSDAATWAELAEQYSRLGHFDKAVFAAKEVLLLVPTAYNLFASAGRYQFFHFLQGEKNDSSYAATMAQFRLIHESRDLFLRSVEISASYLDGWIGVYNTTSDHVIKKFQSHKTLAKDQKTIQFITDSEKLHQLAKKRIIDLGIPESQLPQYLRY